MTNEDFNGATKKGLSFLGKYEIKFRDKIVPHIPKYIETYHLTLLTIVWSTLIIIFAYLTKYSISWIWAISILILFQYITDLFDGAIGRYRKTGLVRWGYYMDHFLDFIFLSAIMIGYAFIIPNGFNFWLFSIFAIYSAFMINSFLYFSVKDEFKISFYGIGPTEIRISFIIINTIIYFSNLNNIIKTLPWICLITFLSLIFVIYQTQKEIWTIDMENKKKRI